MRIHGLGNGESTPVWKVAALVQKATEEEEATKCGGRLGCNVKLELFLRKSLIIP